MTPDGLAPFGELLQPPGYVDTVAYHSIVNSISRTKLREDCFAGADSHAYFKHRRSVEFSPTYRLNFSLNSSSSFILIM